MCGDQLLSVELYRFREIQIGHFCSIRMIDGNRPVLLVLHIHWLTHQRITHARIPFTQRILNLKKNSTTICGKKYHFFENKKFFNLPHDGKTTTKYKCTLNV